MRISNFGWLAFGVASAVAALAPIRDAAAATPESYLEDSQTHAFGNMFYAFRVPALGSDGKTRYYDVTVKFGLSTTGAPATAVVSSVTSPSVSTGAVQPGTYKTNLGDTCVVTNITLTNGRIQSFFECTSTKAFKAEFSVVSGTISAGHPYLSYLTSIGLDKLTDSATYTWGRVTNEATTIPLGGCYFSLRYAMGAKSNGSQVIVSAFYGSNPATFQCSFTLFRQ